MILRSFRSPFRASALALVALFAGCAASGGDGSSAPSPAASVSDDSGEGARAATLADGAFSAEQASRGGELFGQVCGECHAAREFRGTDFFFAWEGSTVGRFVQVVSETMPEDDPGGLPMEQYLALAAYVLQLNEFPAGEAALPADAEYLATLRIARPGETHPAPAVHGATTGRRP